MNELPHRPLVRWLQRALIFVLAGSVLWFVVKTIHWPMTGDASLIHYVTFLIDHGRAPYKDIGDMNLPMSYAPAWLVSHLFGAGDLPWRIYDIVLLAVASVAMGVIARPHGAFPAVWAGCLFALIHGRDGLLQVGQRDLAAAVLLICGVACLFVAMRGVRSSPAAAFGICVGAASMIKPTFAVFLLLVFVAYFVQRKTDRKAATRLRFAMLGWLVPVLGCMAWLAAKGSLGAFWYAVAVVAPYHARIGHAPTGFLFGNSVSPIAWLIAAWLILRWSQWKRLHEHDARVPHPSRLRLLRWVGSMTFDRRSDSFSEALLERRLLLLAAAFGYLSYLVQQRAYQYHRYPFQVFILLVMALDFTHALRSAGWVRYIGVAALVWGAAVFAPISAVKAGRYASSSQPFRSALEVDLLHVQHDRGLESLDGRVQCLDSISGCIATLDAMRLVESTGVMYDEFLFNAGGTRVVDEARAGFLKDVESNPPLIFVVSAPLFPSGPEEYRKLDQWLQFRNWLTEHYAIDAERRPTPAPRVTEWTAMSPGYRIYIRK